MSSPIISMDKSTANVRPEILALGTLIETTIERVSVNESKRHGDGMLFLDNRLTAFPVRVIQDPVLEPVDKLAWMTILLQARATRGYAAFPSSSDICKTANIASRSTVARAIAVLRATRWLTLCTRIRGNVFALHGEPLPLADVLYLDTGYMAFLQDAQKNVHARVRQVVKGVLATLDEDIRRGVNVCAGDHPTCGHRDAVESLANEAAGRSTACSAPAVDEARNTRSNAPKSERPEPESSVTQTRPVADTAPITRIDGDPLIYPKRLGENPRELTHRYLSCVLPEQRQPILDELEGRFRSETRGMRPLYDEMSFLYSLCKAMRNGKFKLNLGVPVQAERAAREKARKRSQHRIQTPHHTDPRKLRDQLKTGTDALSRMKASLGQHDRSDPDASQASGSSPND